MSILTLFLCLLTGLAFGAGFVLTFLRNKPADGMPLIIISIALFIVCLFVGAIK
jgi:uncharacterized membrane protein AbrB (regulator of aidB expression)